jgi:hypothetical protein
VGLACEQLQPGASFEWASYGLTVVSTIHSVDERAPVLWGGTSGGITEVHEWVFSQIPAGVHVTTEESFASGPVETDVTGMQSAPDGLPPGLRTSRPWPRVSESASAVRTACA